MAGRVVIITGAAKGIGRYIASTFADNGDSLALVDIDSLDTVRDDLRPTGVLVLPVEADVSSPESVEAMVAQVMDRFGRVDVLVNNAGVVPHFNWGVASWPRIRDMEPGFWNRVIGTNLGGTYLCTRYVLPHMEAQRSGHVLNLYGGGSTANTACAYVVSKEAIRVFTHFVAEEERPFNIRVIAVHPGAAIATWEAPAEARARMPGPEIVAERFVLASNAGMEMSGQLVTLVDGILTVEKPRDYAPPLPQV